jgi:hypothetical protein
MACTGIPIPPGIRSRARSVIAAGAQRQEQLSHHLPIGRRLCLGRIAGRLRFDMSEHLHRQPLFRTRPRRCRRLKFGGQRGRIARQEDACPMAASFGGGGRVATRSRRGSLTNCCPCRERLAWPRPSQSASSLVSNLIRSRPSDNQPNRRAMGRSFACSLGLGRSCAFIPVNWLRLGAPGCLPRRS